MSRIVDDDPPIKTHPANQAYRDNWEATFGEPEEPAGKDPMPYGCGVCGEPVGCVCDDHDPACERLCTEGADCNCGARC